AVPAADPRRRAALGSHDGGGANRDLLRVPRPHGRPPRERRVRRRQPAAAGADGGDGPRSRRGAARDGRAVRRDEGAARRLLPDRRRVARRGARVGGEDPVRTPRLGRGAAGRPGARGDAGLMQHMLLIYSDEQAWARLPEAERDAIVREYAALAGELSERGSYVGGAPLHP